jgi:UDPglucose--hexose-1-phosphate uridylyltransferase
VSELRLNPLTGRWVTVSAQRAERPSAFATRFLPVEGGPARPCPFCPGNEAEAEPPIESYGPGDEWHVRVLPNRYPAFTGGTEALTAKNLGPVLTQATASGMHEVLVLSRDHDASWADLSDQQAGLAMAAIRDRLEEHTAAAGVRYTQAIVNHGREAGASLVHPHGQLLAIPFVPGEIAAEEAGFARFVGGCLMCTTLEAEVESGFRVFPPDDAAVVFFPFLSGTPYELLVIPRAHEGHLHRAEPADVVAVGRALRTTLDRLRSLLDDVAYNIVFHTSPYRHEGPFHWHAHVLPKVTTEAGFELGTGVLINIVPPELAAAQLNEVARDVVPVE